MTRPKLRLLEQGWSRGRRYRWLLLALLGLMLIWATRRVAEVIWQPDETWARMQRSGALRVGMDASYPPFEWLDEEGRFQGLDVDLARALAERWGVEVQFSNVHFDGLYDALKSDKFDLIISALPHDPMMTRDMLYSYSYFNAGLVILVRADERATASVEDLAARRVAVELGAEAHQYARQLNRDRGMALEILPLRETAEAIAALREGRVDAMLCDRVTAYSYTQDGALRQLDVLLTDEPFVIAARLDAPTMIQEVNAALVAWSEDGTLERLQRRWLHPASP